MGTIVPYISYNDNNSQYKTKYLTDYINNNNYNIKKLEPNDFDFTKNPINLLLDNKNNTIIARNQNSNWKFDFLSFFIGGIVIGSGIYFVYKYKTKKQTKI